MNKKVPWRIGKKFIAVLGGDLLLARMFATLIVASEFFYWLHPKPQVAVCSDGHRRSRALP